MHQSLMLRIHSKYTPDQFSGTKRMRPVFDRRDRGRRERLDVDEPLIGEQRLEYGVAAIAARHRELVRLDSIDEPQRPPDRRRLRVRATPRSRPR